MPNSEHVTWLVRDVDERQGVPAWNNRRSLQEFAPDLSGLDIANTFHNAGKFLTWEKPDTEEGLQPVSLPKIIDLSLINLAGADLSRANFRGVNLCDADLRHASLDDTDLTSASLIGANLDRAPLCRAKLFAHQNGGHENRTPVKITENLSAVLAAVQSLRKIYLNAVFYFRGESKTDWALSPSLMRDSHANHEDEMLQELILRRPEEFNAIRPAVSQWVLAQHHGLKTRFLDVTRNPLVALFNACGGGDQVKGTNQNMYGRLHIFTVPKVLIKPFDSNTISVIANLAKLSSTEKRILLGQMSPFSFPTSNYSGVMHRLHQLIQLEKPYFTNRINPKDFYKVFVVEPQQFSERIKAQSGAFLLSGFHQRFEKEEVLKRIPGVRIYDHYRLSIPGERKPPIIEELESMNITQESLFPGLDSSAAAVTKSFDPSL